MTLIWTTINSNEKNASASIAFSKVGQSKDCLTKKSCGAASNASTRSIHFCKDDDARIERNGQERRRRSDAFVARSVSLFSLSRLRQHRRAGGANHDDVQSHGGEAALANERSLRENHGFLPFATGTRSTPTRDLRRLSETPIVGWHRRWAHIHRARCGGHDRAQLVICEIRSASAGNKRTVRAQARRARHHRRRHH